MGERPFPDFSRLNFQVRFLPDLVFALVTFLVAVASIILFFHWRRYNVGESKVFSWVQVLYFLGLVIGLLGAYGGLNLIHAAP